MYHDTQYEFVWNVVKILTIAGEDGSSDGSMGRIDTDSYELAVNRSTLQELIPELLPEQRQALAEFRNKVSRSIPAPYEFLGNDGYLIKWLRGSSFNVKEATQNFKQELQWREETKLDKILDEDLSDLGFVYKLNQFDSEGRPILFIPFGTWDLRQAVVSGKKKRLERFVYKMYFEADTLLRQLQDEGKRNVTRFVAVVNMNGFNMIQHSCLKCLSLYTSLLIDFETHFPESIHKAVFVNTPTMFEFILKSMKAVMSPELKKVFYVYGRNRNEWDPSIVQITDVEGADYYDYDEE